MESSAYQYHVGGSVPIDAPSYVERQADTALYQKLRAGEFCYVLNSRQMGKSSLWLHTTQKLEAAGIVCVAIDITVIGTQDVTPAQWYGSLIRCLNQGFGDHPLVDLTGWWGDRRMLTPQQCFWEFLAAMLERVPQPIVIFIDEIDSLSSLPFKDDFFALIRACYNHRAKAPTFRRLTFGLIGSATPSDLIQAKTRTPFNIGHAIDLSGFTFEEAEKLTQGLVDAAAPDTVLREILAWTGGQPFLTQKLCELVRTRQSPIAAGEERVQIQQLVEQHIIQNWEAKDELEHLKTIRNRLLSDERQIGQCLGLYREILQNGHVPAGQSAEHLQLQLAGLVLKRQDRLRIYNRIYQSVFDQAWIDRELKKLRPYNDAIYAWESDGQGDRHLLQGTALQNALGWAVDKSLGSLDYQFLTTSQALERQEVQKYIETLQQTLKELGSQPNRPDSPTAEARQPAFDTLQRLFTYMTPASFQGIFPSFEKSLSLITETLSMVDRMMDNEDFDITGYFHQLLQMLTSKITEILAADRSTIYLLNADADELWSVAAQGKN
ncbi:MAG: AAA-like domain-containing protein, partial [Cyanobacteria bacterium P01_A01_bin.135]